MPETQVKGRNIGDGSVGRPDLNVATSGQAVITKVLEVANSGIRISSFTGADTGTGDVGLAIDTTYLSTLYQAKLNGTGLVRMNGTSVSYDNTTYYHAGNLPAYPTTAANANALGNVTYEKFVFGENQSGQRNADSAVWSSTADSQWKSGFWDVNGAPWLPTPDWYWGITTSHRSNGPAYNYCGQLVFNLLGTESYFRSISEGTANTWRKLWHDGNFIDNHVNWNTAFAHSQSAHVAANHIHTLLTSLDNYVWLPGYKPNDYAMGIQTSFVQPETGWPHYGSVMNLRTYSGGGGSLQIFTPYGPSFGGNTLKVRFGNYEVDSGNSWTGWKSLWHDGNFDPASKLSTPTGLISDRVPRWNGSTFVNTDMTYTDTYGSSALRIDNANQSGATCSSNLYLYGWNGTTNNIIGSFFASAASWTFGTILPNQLTVFAAQTGGLGLRTGPAPIRFYQGGALGSFSSPEVMTVSGTFVGIGYTTDPSASRFAVNGAGYFAGTLTVGGNYTQQITHGENHRLELSAAENGLGNGAISLYTWISEPGMTWTGAAIARNMYNTTSFSRVNSNHTSQMMRFTEGENIEFTIETVAGNRYYPLILAPGIVSVSGNITATGSGTFQGGGFNSRRELKTLHADWEGKALDVISRFKVRDFNYNTCLDHNRTLGFIVDEVPADVAQYALSGQERDSVNTYTLHGLSFKAHQETRNEIERLKSMIKELERRLN